VITKRIRRSGAGRQIAADVHVVIATGTGGGEVRASSRRRVRIVQRNGRTEVDDRLTATADPEQTG